MKTDVKHFLSIFIIITFSFLYYNSNITYKFGQLDFFWSPSMHYAYSNIFKDYFLDFFNSFYLYDTELGFNHIYYPFSPLNPFYALSFLGLEDYAINVSNFVAISSVAFFLFRISKILNLSWQKTYIIILIPVTFVSMYGYAFNQASLNSYIYCWLYVLFYFDLNNRTVNYSFYIFFLILIVLTSSFLIIFNLIILFFMMLFFYKFKKEHISDLFFFISLNLLLFLIVLFPYLIAKTNLATIEFSNILIGSFLILTFLIVTYNFIKLLKNNYIKNINLELLKRNFIVKKVNKILIFLLFLVTVYLIYSNYNVLIDLLKPSKTYNVITFFFKKLSYQDLFSQVRISSGVFLYTPLGLLIFTIITYQKNSGYLKILLIILISIVFFTYVINSEFFHKYLGSRYIRGHLNFIPIVILLFIYLNLLSNVENSSNNYYLKNIKFNRNIFLPPALLLDYYLIIQHNHKEVSYIYLFLLYIPFLIIFIKNDYFRKKYIYFPIIIFFILQPILNVEIVKDIRGGFAGVKVNQFNLDQYNDFMNCFREKSNDYKYERVLATATRPYKRFKAPILVMLTERERSKGINVLYRRIEINYNNLERTYKRLLDYDYYGKYQWSPVFFNTKSKQYFFDENFFDQLGINSVIVFDDKEKKFQSKYKSFILKGTCKTELYKADIYKSLNSRGVATLVDKNEKIIKLKHITKNSWDISNLNFSDQAKFLLKFAIFPKTEIYIDGNRVDYIENNGNITIPYKSGNELKIIYQNDYHRLHFLLVLILYFILIFILFKFTIKCLIINK